MQQSHKTVSVQWYILKDLRSGITQVDIACFVMWPHREAGQGAEAVVRGVQTRKRGQPAQALQALQLVAAQHELAQRRKRRQALQGSTDRFPG